GVSVVTGVTTGFTQVTSVIECVTAAQVTRRGDAYEVTAAGRNSGPRSAVWVPGGPSVPRSGALVSTLSRWSKRLSTRATWRAPWPGRPSPRRRTSTSDRRRGDRRPAGRARVRGHARPSPAVSAPARRTAGEEGAASTRAGFPAGSRPLTPGANAPGTVRTTEFTWNRSPHRPTAHRPADPEGDSA